MPNVPARFKGLASSFAAIAADLFTGRFAWISDISRVVWYYTASSYAVLARKDIAETFVGLTDTTLTASLPVVTDANKKLVSESNADFRTRIAAQPSDATLTALAGLATAADKLPYFTSADVAALTTLSAFIRTLLDDADAATAKTTLGIPLTVTRELMIQSLPITNAAPDVITLGPSGSMKTFGFDGGTQTEELFYYIDNQHDYVAGGSFIPHVHWFQASNGTGTVVMSFDIQIVDAGGPVVAPVANDCPAVTVNGTAWAAEQRSEVTVSGVGHTFNSRIMLRLYRDPSKDTFTGDVALTAIGVQYTADPLQSGAV